MSLDISVVLWFYLAIGFIYYFLWLLSWLLHKWKKVALKLEKVFADVLTDYMLSSLSS